MTNINSLKEAKELFEDGQRIPAIKLLRKNNEGMELVEARCLLDEEYKKRREQKKQADLMPEMVATMQKIRPFIMHVKEHEYDVQAQRLASVLLYEADDLLKRVGSYGRRPESS